MLLIKNVDYLVRDAGRIEANADLLIEGGRIRKIGAVNEDDVSVMGSGARPGEIIDGRGMIAMPGFINTHTHCYQSLLKGIRDDLRLNDWVERVTLPFISLCRQEEAQKPVPRLGYLSAMMGAIEMVKSGVTSFVDLDYAQPEILQAFQKLGVRGTLCVQLVDRWLPPSVTAALDKRKRKLLEIIDAWHGQDLQQVAISPSTPFSCTPELLAWISKTAYEHSLAIHVHIGETTWEINQSLKETGKTPFGYLDSLDFFRQPVNAVHCVHVTDYDIEILKERNATVIYCPKSNAKLGSGIAPIPRFLKEGIPVAIATDGFASNDTNDMFEEMRFGQLIQKALHEDPQALAAESVYHMATQAGGRVVGLELGQLEEGALADVVLLKRGKIHLEPINNLLQTILYCGKAFDVDTVIVGGKKVLENGNILTVAENDIIQEAIDTMADISGSLEACLKTTL